ncbi:MAG TPA: recombinase family protein, partial [Chthonomonadaceae bacterium]|nr:recombinase family protein [Chthonomonadaceae bacterium]
GEFMFNITGDVAAYYRKLFRKKSMDGKRSLAEQGIQPCRSTSPFGYAVPTKADILKGLFPPEALGRYLVMEEEATIVQKMFARYRDGDSLRDICRWLEKSGVPTRNGGAFWKPKTIKQMLSNPVYKGQATFGKRLLVYDEARLEKGFKRPATMCFRDPSEWIFVDSPPIVSEALWDACQERLQEGRRLYGGNPQRKQMLTGLLRCPVCGRSMVAHSRDRSRKNVQKPRTPFRRGVSYYCPRARPSTNAAGLVCHPKYYNGEKAEELVLTGVRAAARRPAMLTAALAVYREAESNAFSETALRQVQAELGAIEVKERATAEAQVDAMTKGRSTEVYERILGDLHTKRTDLEARLRALEEQRTRQAARLPQDDSELLADALGDLEVALTDPYLTPAEKHDLLCRLIKEIRPEGDGYRLYLRPLQEGVGTVTTMTALSPCPTSRKVTRSSPAGARRETPQPASSTTASANSSS